MTLLTSLGQRPSGERMANKHLIIVALLALAAVAALFAQTTVAQVLPTKLNAADVTTSRGAPVDDDEWASAGSNALGTTEAFPFAADLTSDQRSALFVQNIRVTNRHASNFVCFFPVDYSAGCATDCPAATRTCSASANDGDAIAPGASYSISLTGTECPCLVASAASTTFSAARVGRFPN